MKTSLSYSALFTACLLTGAVNVFSAETEPAGDSAPLSRDRAALVTVVASVEAVDYTNREVILKGPLGNKVTLTVDQRVKRLDEVSVGDFVRADYYVSLAAELREPTPEEKEHPLVLLDAAGKAPAGSQPAAGGVRRFKVVTTIEGVDRPTQTITVKGPRGNYLTARVATPERLSQMHIGDNIVITYTEALAISLEKTDKKVAN